MKRTKVCATSVCLLSLCSLLRRGYCKLQEEALHWTMWRTWFWRG